MTLLKFSAAIKDQVVAAIARWITAK